MATFGTNMQITDTYWHTGHSNFTYRLGSSHVNEHKHLISPHVKVISENMRKMLLGPYC